MRNESFKLKASEINTQFWNNYRQIVKMNVFIDHLTKDAPLDFILNELDKTKEYLEQREHDIHFFMINKNQPYQKIDSRVIFDSKGIFMLDKFSVSTFKLFYENYSIDKLHEAYYENNRLYECILPIDTTEREERKLKQIASLNDIRQDLINYDIYLLKSDVDSLVDGINFSDGQFFIFDDGHIDGNRSDDYEREKASDEFETSGAYDLAFDLWLKDKENFLKNLKNPTSKNLNVLTQEKEISKKSENKKNAFIKSLLKIHYGEEVAENPRAHIYDPNMSEKSRDGKIQKDFELHGLTKHLPTGKTLKNWVDSVELDN